ncbi:MAG: hypothetical protein CL489_10945 [Acidobacteria bacterium]|nr:hypothetical protein [Acidobacteriota bacterium]|tara:strand:- start:4598 stop:5158 length:561 start_codon:yes stop_codon:yes gene_type:complete
MARHLRAEDVFNYEETHRGIFNNIEANLISVIREGFEENELLQGLTPNTYINDNPKHLSLSFSDLPACCAWTDGKTGTVKTAGQGRSGKSHNEEESFYANVEIVHSSIDERDSRMDVKTIAAGLDQVLRENSTLNGLFNAHCEIVESTVLPTNHIIDDRLEPVNCVTFRIIYRKTRKTVTASHIRR